MSAIDRQRIDEAHRRGYFLATLAESETVRPTIEVYEHEVDAAGLPYCVAMIDAVGASVIGGFRQHGKLYGVRVFHEQIDLAAQTVIEELRPLVEAATGVNSTARGAA